MSLDAVLDPLRKQLGGAPKEDLVARLKLELVDVRRLVDSVAQGGGTFAYFLHFNAPGFVQSPPLRLDTVQEHRNLVVALEAAIARAEALEGAKAIEAERARYAITFFPQVLA